MADITLVNRRGVIKGQITRILSYTQGRVKQHRSRPNKK